MSSLRYGMISWEGQEGDEKQTLTVSHDSMRASYACNRLRLALLSLSTTP